MPPLLLVGAILGFCWFSRRKPIPATSKGRVVMSLQEPNPFIWLVFPDGAVFQLRREGSGLDVREDSAEDELNKAVNEMTVKAKQLLSYPAAGQC